MPYYEQALTAAEQMRDEGKAEREPRFAIGQQFMTRGKAPRLCTVTDILRTYNSAGNLVQIRYVATHEFAGQVVTDSNVVETTIAMGIAGGAA